MRAFDRTGLKVERTDDQRFVDALGFFQEGKTLEFEDTVFILDVDRGVLSVLKVTTRSIGEFDVESAAVEIERAIAVHSYLCRSSAKFERITEGYDVRFAIVSDYGMGSVEICHLEGRTLVWN